MIRLLFRLLVVGVVLVALYLILSPGIYKSIQANLNGQTDVSATVVSQLQTPVAAISTPVHAAINPTVVGTTTSTPTGTTTPTPTSTTTNNSSSNPSSNSSSALTYSNGNSSTLKKLMNEFPNTGVAPPQGSSYDNYTFPRKY